MSRQVQQAATVFRAHYPLTALLAAFSFLKD